MGCLKKNTILHLHYWHEEGWRWEEKEDTGVQYSILIKQTLQVSEAYHLKILLKVCF